MTIKRSWSGGGGGWSVLVHGGAGDVAPERREAHAAGCLAAARAAAELLREGGSALDAAVRAVEALEDDPKFNAGTGACLATDGKLHLDASVMDGDLRAGAVCALPAFEHPVAIARRVLEDSEHVLYAGEGARVFARQAGFDPAPESSMITDAARANLARAMASGKAQSWAGDTVGAVARDASGQVVAATSTGGTIAKKPGRVGDTPILGAGTYADRGAGAASATGYGEAIMKLGLTWAAIEGLRRGVPPEEAARTVIDRLKARLDATAGIIVVDATGRLGFARSTETMSWGAVWSDGDAESGA